MKNSQNRFILCVCVFFLDCYFVHFRNLLSLCKTKMRWHMALNWYIQSEVKINFKLPHLNMLELIFFLHREIVGWLRWNAIKKLFEIESWVNSKVQRMNWTNKNNTFESLKKYWLKLTLQMNFLNESKKFT